MNFPDPALWNLSIHRNTIASAISGVNVVIGNYDVLHSALKEIAASKTDLERTQTLLEAVEQWLTKLALVKKIGGIQEDILGAYFFRIPEIRLYWMVIGMMARALRVSVEGLTFVVAAHELAHAYTHLGRDIDAKRWATEAFASADLRIVEGLAQFYAGVICSRLADRFPAAKEAYDGLLAIQSGAYTAHRKWGGIEDSTGEVVRFTMIETRSRTSFPYDEFTDELENVRLRTARRRPARAT
ncbi:MAG TPA: hypothetical protein VEB03_00720 [Candidatus Nanoarchaeia archaeon]|nr:hypothetical protein [Candidatus Nanoarchaeia archaeon]